jgi:hypothetical protein
MTVGLRASLEIAAAITAALSAACWVKSASVTFPAMQTYWGFTPPIDPYQMAVNAAAAWNAWAASFAAGAAFAQALALLAARWSERPSWWRWGRG